MKKAVTIGMLCSALFMLSACSGSPVDNSKPTVVSSQVTNPTIAKPTVDSSQLVSPTAIKPTVSSSQTGKPTVVGYQGVQSTFEDTRASYLKGCNPTNNINLIAYCGCTFQKIVERYGVDRLSDLVTKLASTDGADELKAITESCVDTIVTK